MAFKMNREGFTFYTKTDERVKDDLINIRKNERPTEQGPTKMDENKGYPKVKPDYIDIDGDGNKTESMKDAAASKKGFSKTPYKKNKLPKLQSKITKVATGFKPQSQMTEEELAELKGIKNPQTIESKKGFSKTPYEKNKYSSHMPKHGADHKISDADKKRKEVLIEKLNKMSDPVDSNQGKATLKAIKKIDPNFDAETYM